MGDFSRASPCFLTGLVIFPGAVAVALAESGGEGRDFSGSVQMGDETIICSGTHGEQDIASAFANSCNVAFAQIAQELGPGTLEKYTEQAGLTGSYSISGLPAGPISNPGYAAIEAALNPDQEYIDEGYYFFVTGHPGTDVAGQYFYAKTADEHYQNCVKAGWA